MRSFGLAVLVSLTLSYALHSAAASTQTVEATDDEQMKIINLTIV